MTGEITLRGRVLPIGGLKSKILAAHLAGAKIVILPKKNEKDLRDVPEEIRKSIKLVLADSMEQVLEAALRRRPRPLVVEPAEVIEGGKTAQARAREPRSPHDLPAGRPAAGRRAAGRRVTDEPGGPGRCQVLPLLAPCQLLSGRSDGTVPAAIALTHRSAAERLTGIPARFLPRSLPLIDLTCSVLATVSALNNWREPS